ncbi:MAG: formyltetrahydrofolate deformylase [Microthrixaceae bacterium]
MGATAVLLLSCPDQPGVVASVAEFVWRHGGNIIHAEQHIDTNHADADGSGLFFQRVEFELAGFAVPRQELAAAFAPIADRFGMQVKIHFSDELPRLAVLASKAPHCLIDLLSRWHMGELAAELVLVASNHPDHQKLCEFFGVPFYELPVGESAAAQDQAMQDLLQSMNIERIVLARYMRVLSREFVDRWPNGIINIHHSFLPAFVGANPYRQALERGVKVIGATAHFVTASLDQGPIIAQDVAAVSHRDGVEELTRKGRDLEVMVLARALEAHLDHRVLTYGNRTVVFH